MNNKYFAFMKNSDGKEVVTQGWKLEAIKEWIKFHENLGYKITKCDLGKQ